jgi:hypothetical protein
MEVKMQTSFIPKKPVAGNTHSGGGGVSLFLLLAIIIFIVTIATSFGVWIFQKSLVSKIEKLSESLESSRSSYEEKTIIDLIRLNDRIEQSKSLLNKHIAISPLFTVLETKVVKNIRLKNMKFSADNTGKMKLDISGIASSYDALSKQSDIFGDRVLREYISEPVISDFSPNVDGSISFNFKSSVMPKLVTYQPIVIDSVDTTSNEDQNNNDNLSI